MYIPWKVFFPGKWGILKSTDSSRITKWGPWFFLCGACWCNKCWKDNVKVRMLHILSLQWGLVGTGYPHMWGKLLMLHQRFLIHGKLFHFVMNMVCTPIPEELFVWLRNYMDSPVWWEIEVLEMWIFFHLVQLDEIPFLQFFSVLFFPFHHMLLHLILPHLWKEGLCTIWFFDILNFLAAC